MLKKFLQDFFSYQFSHILGGKKYEDWAAKTLTLHTNIPIKNTKLAKELEYACQKNGFLTYAQFLSIDQFGKKGYHATHKEHGMTDVRFRWPEALTVLCKKNDFHHLVEFGPGDGKLGIQTLIKAKKQHFPLFWSGIEINKKLQEETKKLFIKNHLQNQLIQLTDSIENIHIKEKCLFVFSYSLDNLIPDVFINISQKKHYPNAMLGVMVKNGLLTEILLTEKDLQKVHCSLKNGIYTDASGYTWDVQAWQLHPMQRVYLPLMAYQTLDETTRMLPTGSKILIIDEFRIPNKKQPFHYGLPRDLETYSRDFEDFEKLYRSAGENLLYFPLYKNTTMTFLEDLGFSLENSDGEHKLAFSLAGKNTPYPKYPRTLAFLSLAKKMTLKKRRFIIIPQA